MKKVDPILYTFLVDNLIYLTITRLYIFYTVGITSRFMQEPFLEIIEILQKEFLDKNNQSWVALY